MELILNRKCKKENYTIGDLIIDGKVFCQIIEDKDRDLDSNMSESEIKSKKVYAQTAIPRGTYEVTLDVFSAKYGSLSFYKEVCNGKVPRLLDVKGFQGILIHCGNTEKDSAGCLIVGMNLEKGKVLKSQETFRKLYKVLNEAKLRGEDIQITIK